MKCVVTSRTTHNVLISKEISYKSFKEICIGEKKKVNLGHWGNWAGMKVENNSLVHIPRKVEDKTSVYGLRSLMPMYWEVLSKFFSHHNIDPNWLDCNYLVGSYDKDLGGYTGGIGKVLETEYLM